MFRLLTVALAAIFLVLQIFGDEARRPEVTRQVQDEVTGISLASFAMPEARATVPASVSGLSEAEAVAMAMEAGRAYRADRAARPLRGMVAAVEPQPAAAGAPASAEWYVTGERVNLRAGPGTENAVVGQLVYGDAAEVLADRDGWYEIRTADGTTSGWIFGRFLTSQLPG